MEVEPLGITEPEFLGKLIMGKLQLECNHFYDMTTNKVVGKIVSFGDFKKITTFTTGD